MAIIIEEEKSKSGLVRIIGWVVVFIVFIVAIYYIFFVTPQLVIIEPSGSLSTIEPIVENPVNPDSVLKSAAFQALQQPTVPMVPTSTGGTGSRSNPFIAP